MQLTIHALLVHQNPEPDLEALLKTLGIVTLRARNCAEAEAMLPRVESPLLIFTDLQLPDGTWTDIKSVADRRRPGLPVIVVSRQVDIPLYLDALDRGVCDFIVPPFSQSELKHVVFGALLGFGLDAEYELTRGTGSPKNLGTNPVGWAAASTSQRWAQSPWFKHRSCRPVFHGTSGLPIERTGRALFPSLNSCAQPNNQHWRRGYVKN
jgi:DNA-binding NtrC family response regulator